MGLLLEYRVIGFKNILLPFITLILFAKLFLKGKNYYCYSK